MNSGDSILCSIIWQLTIKLEWLQHIMILTDITLTLHSIPHTVPPPICLRFSPHHWRAEVNDWGSREYIFADTRPARGEREKTILVRFDIVRGNCKKTFLVYSQTKAVPFYVNIKLSLHLVIYRNRYCFNCSIVFAFLNELDRLEAPKNHTLLVENQSHLNPPPLPPFVYF